MAQQLIFLGTISNDNTGTPLQTGGDMINDNFTELYAAEALNTAKVTNATHSGDATGDTALTLATVNASPGTYAHATVVVNAKGLVTSASAVSHTGDATGTGLLTLATVNANVGSFAHATITVNAKGLVTAASSVAHTGDVTGTGALTLATVNANVGTFTRATITVNAKGLVTAAASGSAQYDIYTDGVSTFRQGVRNLYFVLDQTITATGFSGAENTDWANIRSEQL